MWKTTISLIFTIALLTACGDDSGTTTPTVQEPPETPIPEMTYSGTGSSDPAAQAVDEYGMLVVEDMNDLMEYFEELLYYMSGTVSYDDGVWTWTYDEGLYTHTITCQQTENGWYWTYSVDGGGLESWMAADGYADIDGYYGWWRFYQWNDSEVLFSAEWSGDSYNGTIWWYHDDFMGEDETLLMQVSWETTDSGESLTVIIPEGHKTRITESTDGSGELFFYDWNIDEEVWSISFEAHWTGEGTGWYKNYITDNTVTWG